MSEVSAPRSSRASIATTLVAFLGLLAGIEGADASTGAWVGGDLVQARLIAAVAGTGTLDVVPVGVEIKLDDHWKTYWRSPGDAGLPPALDWQGSANLDHVTLLYPKPRRLTLLGLQTFGYEHGVILPLDVRPTAPGQPLVLKAKLDLLVCAQLCVPRSLALDLAIPAGPAQPEPEAQRIAKARAAVPGGAAVSGLSVDRVAAIRDAGRPALQIDLQSRDPLDAPDVIAETEPALNFGAPRVIVTDARHATLVMALSEALPVGASLADRAVTLTVIDGDRALEQTSRVTRGASTAPDPSTPSFLAILALAVLGGLILNLMPCVLPVLSLKFIAVVSQGGRAVATVRRGFLATAVGIVASFLALAVLLLGVKAAGRTVGWGIQFQQPVFIASLAVLVTLFACHLWGLFEIPLPRFIAGIASRRTGPDENLAGHFVTGAFATLLATPCSAPFLGTAVGFALAGTTTQLLAVFLCLGVGLALPYLTVAAFPRLATRLPRPGRWMVVVKKAMALPLVGTGVWLLMILRTEVGAPTAVLTGVLLAAITAVLLRRAKRPDLPGRLTITAIAALGLVAVILPGLVSPRGGSRTDPDAIAWRGFDRNTIKSLVSQGKTVFVDVTADWCLTCQANKRLVLSEDAMTRRLNAEAVPMQADWTRPDATIAAYLAAYGRYGIPFNIVYGPGAPSGIILPELLTTHDVAAALDKAQVEHHAEGLLEGSPRRAF